MGARGRRGGDPGGRHAAARSAASPILSVALSINDAPGAAGIGAAARARRRHRHRCDGRSCGWSRTPTPATSSRTTSRASSSIDRISRGCSRRRVPTRAASFGPGCAWSSCASRTACAITPASASSLPVLRITSPANPVDELPDLTDCWAWAHAQVAAADTRAATVRDGAARRAPSFRCRGSCARDCSTPTPTYIACVVPTFELGRTCRARRHAGRERCDRRECARRRVVDGTTAAGAAVPAGRCQAAGLPSMAIPDRRDRRLRVARTPIASAARTRSSGSADDRYQSSRLCAGSTTRRGDDHRSRRRAEADGRAERSARMAGRCGERIQERRSPRSSTRPAWRQPPIRTPIRCSRRRSTAAGMRRSATVRRRHRRGSMQLNLDPRYRGVAAFGTHVVQEHQEALMASAWEQAAELREANQRLRQLQLSLVVGTRCTRSTSRRSCPRRCCASRRPHSDGCARRCPRIPSRKPSSRGSCLRHCPCRRRAARCAASDACAGR